MCVCGGVERDCAAENHKCLLGRDPLTQKTPGWAGCLVAWCCPGESGEGDRERGGARSWTGREDDTASYRRET